MQDFEQETRDRIQEMTRDPALQFAAAEFTRRSVAARYSYNFRWLGRPIIQYPQDMVAMQELVWATRPDLIIETGIAHGGSLVLSAFDGGPLRLQGEGLELMILVMPQTAEPIPPIPDWVLRFSEGR